MSIRMSRHRPSNSDVNDEMSRAGINVLRFWGVVNPVCSILLLFPMHYGLDLLFLTRFEEPETVGGSTASPYAYTMDGCSCRWPRVFVAVLAI